TSNADLANGATHDTKAGLRLRAASPTSNADLANGTTREATDAGPRLRAAPTVNADLANGATRGRVADPLRRAGGDALTGPVAALPAGAGPAGQLIAAAIRRGTTALPGRTLGLWRAAALPGCPSATTGDAGAGAGQAVPTASSTGRVVIDTADVA